MQLTHDTALPVPLRAADSADAPLPFDPLMLRRDVAAPTRASAAGLNASASLTAAHAIELHFDKDEVQHTLTVRGARATTCAMTPAGFERTLHVADSDTVHERVLVDAETANIVVEWSDITSAFMIEWMIQAHAPITWNCAAGSIIVATAAHALLITIAADTEWSFSDVSDESTSRLVARAQIERAPHAVRLYATSAPRPGRRTPVFPTLHEVSARMIADAATMRRRARHGLAVDVPSDDTIANGLEWAKQLIPRIAAADDAVRAMVCATSLACGDADVARRTLSSIAEPRLLLLTSALYFDWTADAATINQLWPRLADAFDTPGIDADATAAIVPVAEETGQRDFLAGHAHAVSKLKARPPHGPADALQRDMRDERDDHLRFVSCLARDVFGIAPEAARGRLRIAPKFPDAWQSVDLRGLRIADASVTLQYRASRDRTSTVHRFTINQDSGPVPIRLVFEPALPLARQGSPACTATVDGVAAALDLRRLGDRIVAPVQVVLDDERVIEIRVGV